MGLVLGVAGTELERMLAPISHDRPAGEDLRYTEVYDQIQEARREDDPSLPQGVWQTTLKRADWATVSDICAGALTSRSKDLQLAAWLLEARFHQEGLPGVQVGLALISELCTRYWEGLFPGEPADLEARLSPIHWLNEKFSFRLRHIPVAQPADGDSPIYTVADWEDALRRSDKEQKERICQSAAGSSRRFYVELLESVSGTSREATRLERLLQERSGGDEPSLGRFKGHLTSAQRILTAFLAEYQHEAEPDPGPPEAQPAVGAPETGSRNAAATEADGPPAPRPRVRSREEAYLLLAEIAEFLLRAEPHSPTPYLIKRAVAWGRMPLAEVLQELVNDPKDLRAVYSLLGIEGGGAA
jgi:type VI secretion system protein ImpA